ARPERGPGLSPGPATRRVTGQSDRPRPDRGPDHARLPQLRGLTGRLRRMPEAIDHSTIDAAVELLRTRRAAWVAVAPAARESLIRELRRDVAAVAERWTAAVAQAES